MSYSPPGRSVSYHIHWSYSSERGCCQIMFVPRVHTSARYKYIMSLYCHCCHVASVYQNARRIGLVDGLETNIFWVWPVNVLIMLLIVLLILSLIVLLTNRRAARPHLSKVQTASSGIVYFESVCYHASFLTSEVVSWRINHVWRYYVVYVQLGIVWDVWYRTWHLQ